MKRSSLDGVFTSFPANKTAARVVARGIHYTPPERRRPADAVYSDELPLIVNLPRDEPNYAGLRIGRLTVIGYIGDHLDKDGQSKHSRWLVRCLCGVYEHRRGRGIRRLMASSDQWTAACWECQNLERLRGKKPETDNWQDKPLPTVALLPGANDVFAGGERFGRVTVVGYGGSARWVVRCDCGAYGYMTSRGLRRSALPQCTQCYYAARPIGDVEGASS